MENKSGKELKLRGAKSLELTIMFLSDIAIIITIIISMLISMPNYNKSLKEQVKNNMENLFIAYGKLVDNSLDKDGNIAKKDLANLLKDVQVQGIESSYAYLVSKEGVMEYHPISDKIGQPVENAVVTEVVDELKKGNVPDNKVVEYDFRGTTKYAGYYISPKNHSILVVSADESEVTAPVNKLIKVTIIVVAISVIGIGLVVKLLVKRIVKPIKKLEKIVNKTAEFDFTHAEGTESIITRKDEIGQIGRSIQKMRTNIREIIGRIDNVSELISNNAINLKDITNRVNDNSTDNSATTEELSAGMDETAITTDEINKNVLSIEDKVKDINGLTDECLNVSEEILDKAERIKSKTVEAKKYSKKLCDEVKEKTEVAMEQAKAVNKINELANAIMGITEQTSLLALNASIEAARAGDSGKGFAVVASEISNLANQSSETVKGIADIVEEVHQAVENMTNCMEQTIEFLNNNIANDYEEFTQVGLQYSQDASLFKSNTNNINDSINVLSQTITNISQAISSMNTTINNSSIGIRNIAEKTSDIVNLTNQTFDSVEETVEYSNKLKEVVSKFTL